MVWVQLAASVVIVATFIAVTRLKSFAPPLVDLAEKPRRFRVARVWTLEERRAKLGDESELVFQNRWFAMYLTVFLSVLTLRVHRSRDCGVRQRSLVRGSGSHTCLRVARLCGLAGAARRADRRTPMD